MPVQQGFHFSQASLQDFVNCPRRFQLRYMDHLAWPAVESEPALENERYMQQGQRFHRLVQQHAIGVPAQRLEKMINQEDLAYWWKNYVSHGITLTGNALSKAEVALYAPLRGFRLLAKYDALVFINNEEEGKALIIDWKTSRIRPSRRWLAERLQTRVYPYLLVKAGACLNQDNPIFPEKVEMIYWFAAFPDQPERFSYSAGQCAQDEAFLIDLIDQIQAMGEGKFPLALDETACRFCTYRSLCARGESAGKWDEELELGDQTGEQSPIELDFDFEQIAEIKF
jgi:CRISPR/Cas system-associated exonuclease Cas4 (RecB family)